MTNRFDPDPSSTACGIYERDTHRVRSPFEDESDFDDVAGFKEVETELAAGKSCGIGHMVCAATFLPRAAQPMDCCGRHPAYLPHRQLLARNQFDKPDQIGSVTAAVARHGPLPKLSLQCGFRHACEQLQPLLG